MTSNKDNYQRRLTPNNAGKRARSNASKSGSSSSFSSSSSRNKSNLSTSTRRSAPQKRSSSAYKSSLNNTSSGKVSSKKNSQAGVKISSRQSASSYKNGMSSTSRNNFGTSRNNFSRNSSVRNNSYNNNSSRNVGKSLAKNKGKKTKKLLFGKFDLKPQIIIICLLVIIAIGGIADFSLNWGKIHTGVKVQGVNVGGMSVEQASSTISDALTPIVDDADVVMYASAKAAELDGYEGLNDEVDEEASAKAVKKHTNSEKKWEITQGTVGAYIDGEALANEAYKVGRSGWTLIFDRMLATLHLKNIDAEISTSSNLQQEFSDSVNKKIGTKIKEYSFKIKKSRAKIVNGHDGWLLDSETFLQRLSVAIFNEDGTNYFLAPMQVSYNHISEQVANQVIDKINSSIADPIKITYNSKSWTLDTDTLASFIKKEILEPNQILKFESGTAKVSQSDDNNQDSYDVSYGTDPDSSWVLQPYVDQKNASNYLIEILGDDASSGAKNASFKIKDGKVVIVKSKTGTGPDRDVAAKEIQNILFGSNTNRTIAMVDTVIEPDITTQDAKNMKITDKLSSWSISLGGSTSRMNNIALLCKLINNSIIAPDDTWSFNDTTGERTADKGFQTAPVIIDGKHEDQLGGGICQVASCVFNAACYAGLGIESRINHDFYISAYDDAGFADATVSWDEPDLKFVNDTGNYLLLTASFDGGDTVTVSLWGTNDGRIVTCERGKWKKGAKWKTIKVSDDTLKKGTTKVEQEGKDGRSIKIHYLVKSKTGKVLHDITFNSVYSAQNKIISVGTKK